ncbi:MAG: DNA/RNA non-specific endonuclease, partial [Marinirhabdus sp.]
MNRKYLYPLLIILVTAALWYVEKNVGANNEGYPSALTGEKATAGGKFGTVVLPSVTAGGRIVEHRYFTLSYNEEHEQAEWVAYELAKSHLSKNNFDRPYFVEDGSVKTKSADWRNYKNSGYDRGHLCPAGDRRFNYSAYRETFL